MAISDDGPCNARKMRYTDGAMAVFMANNNQNISHHGNCQCGSGFPSNAEISSTRLWLEKNHDTRPPKVVDASSRNIGKYPLTTELSAWVRNTLANYNPDQRLLDFVMPFSVALHATIEKERSVSTGLHDLDLIELLCQSTLEVGAEVLLAADATEEPIELEEELHTSRAANDDHLGIWGKLLTGLECDPPIIAILPIYLMACQAFTFAHGLSQPDYIYSALASIDWARGAFDDKLRKFEQRAIDLVPNLDDAVSAQDRSFWRIGNAYLRAMNLCENSRPLKAPHTAAIHTGLNLDLLLIMRAVDGLAVPFMDREGAAWLDDAGFDSLISTGLPNDIMDLHTDIKTGETRNMLRFLYPTGLTIELSKQSMSTCLSGLLCDLYRGHRRARFDNRGDGRVSAASPMYSFCRARHRRIFEIMEVYINSYPEFWKWTWEIYGLAKEQVTEVALDEPFICSLKRSITRNALPPSPCTRFYDNYYGMIEDRASQSEKIHALAVSPELSGVIYGIHDLWNRKLLSHNKSPGWGREFDIESDRLFGEAGQILSSMGISDEMYRFSTVYGQLSLTLPYIAYHTIDAIIMVHGITN